MWALEKYNELLTLVETTQKEHPQWRYGQTMFNVLTTFAPGIAEIIRGSEIDMFYNDDVVEEFKKAIVNKEKL